MMSENMMLPHPYLYEDRLMHLFLVVMDAVDRENAFPFGLDKLKKTPLVDYAVQIYFQQAGDEKSFKMGRNHLLTSALSLWGMMGLVTANSDNLYDVTEAGKQCVQSYFKDPMRMREEFGGQILDTLWFAQTGYDDGQLGDYLRQHASDATDAHIDATLSLLTAFNLFNRESSAQMVTNDSLAKTQPYEPFVDADVSPTLLHRPIQPNETHTQLTNNPDDHVFALTQPEPNTYVEETFTQLMNVANADAEETFTQPIGDFYQDNTPEFEEPYQPVPDNDYFAHVPEQAMDVPVDNTPYGGQSDVPVNTDSHADAPVDYGRYHDNSASGGVRPGLLERIGGNRGANKPSSTKKPSFGRSIGNSGDAPSSDNPPVQDPPVKNPPVQDPSADNPPVKDPPVTATHTGGHQPFSSPRRNTAPPPPVDDAQLKIGLGQLASGAKTDKTPTQPTRYGRYGQKPGGTTNTTGPRGGNRQVAPPPSDAPPPSQTRATQTVPTTTSPPPTNTPKNDTAIGYLSGESPRKRIGFGAQSPSGDTPQTPQRGMAANSRPTGPRNVPKPTGNPTNTPPPTADIPAYYEETLPNGRVIRLSRQVVHDWMAEKNVGIDEAISALMNLKSDE